MIRVVELFAGIGSQRMALRNLGIEHEVVAISEIDRHAIRSYTAIHGETPNLGDITQIEHLPDCDLVTYSFPCQDLSIAGYKKGMERDSGTRSSLLWEVGRLLADAKERGALPKVLLMENVPAILNKLNIGAFREWMGSLALLGYTNSYAVLNALDFGIPQNRKRCFMVSVLGDSRFVFPEGTPTDRRLRDVLEPEVDESFFLSEEKIAKYEEHKRRHDAKGHGLGWQPRTPDEEGRAITNIPSRHSQNFIITEGDLGEYRARHDPGRSENPDIIVSGRLAMGYDMMARVYDATGVAPTLRTFATGGNQMPKIQVDDWLAYPTCNRKGYMEAYEGDGLVMSRVHRARGTVQAGKAPTLTCMDGCGTGVVVRSSEDESVSNAKEGAFLRIRYLTPLECWRLMGFPDEAYREAERAGASKNQLYKQAGNSIVVDVLMAIFRAIYVDRTFECERQTTLTAFAGDADDTGRRETISQTD